MASPLKPVRADQASGGRFIAAEIEEGRTASVRGVAEAVGLKSSRSGRKLVNNLIAKGWIGKSK